MRIPAALLAGLVASLLAPPTPSSAAQLPFRASRNDTAQRLSDARDGQQQQQHQLTHPSPRVLRHPALPAHRLRFVQPPSGVCEPTSRSWSGYLEVDVDALRPHHPPQHASRGTVEHFYFWAFEARAKEYARDTVLWLNGGPGCSSFTGLLMELGPCNAAPFNTSKGPHTEPNPWSWNNNATMLFLDQPMGVGFSYVSWANGSSHPTPPKPRIWSADEAARDASAFLQLWAMHAADIFGGAESDPHDLPPHHGHGDDEHSGAEPPSSGRVRAKEHRRQGERGDERRHDAAATAEDGATPRRSPAAPGAAPAKKGVRSFHIAGESYAGRWVPLLAARLLEDNERATREPQKGLEPLPLTSVLIGNGITSPRHQFPAYVDYACSNKHGFGTFFPPERCETMRSQVPACVALVERCNQPTYNSDHDVLACRSALDYCEGALSDPWGEDGKSYYDYKHYGDYEQEEWVAAFLNDPSVRRAMGVDVDGAGDSHNGTFVGCSDRVYADFAKTGDGAMDSTWAVKKLLASGVRVLTYAGARDFICNYLGVSAWTLDLEWEGKEAFNAAPLLPWSEAPVPSSSSASSAAPRRGRRAGLVRKAGNFSFVIVDESGHFVPLDQPRAALKMVNNWLHAEGELADAE